MSNLIVIGFKQDMYRASHVLGELRYLNDRWAIELRDAIAVYRTRDGELRLDQSYQHTNPVYVAERLAGYGGTVLRTTLTDEQTAKLQKVLDERGRA